MGEETIRETAAAYTISATRLTIPPEWNWLRAFSTEDRAAFFQEIIDTIIAAQQSNDWAKLTERIAAWKRRAEANGQQSLAELRVTESETTRPRRNTLEQALGLLATSRPAPSDAEVERWLDEHRLEKYG